jgi:formate dehydrogenase major subunit/formate dehydrogenase alpha subunit
VSEITGILASQIREAATLYATGGLGEAASDEYPPSLIYQTTAQAAWPVDADQEYGDPAEITAACINLAIITGNLGRPGGGVASPRGPANAQGATDMGASPDALPGGFDFRDAEARRRFEAAWTPHWSDRATTGNGFVPVRHLASDPGLGQADLAAAIQAGRIKAMYIGNTIAGRFAVLDPALRAALAKLEFLVVSDHYADTPLQELAHVTLPMAMAMEKDGTFTAFDRTVQRLRTAVPAMGEAKSGIEIFTRLANRLGYGMTYRGPAQVMDEIAKLVPGYGGILYARLERGGIPVPATGYGSAGTPLLSATDDGRGGLAPALALVGARG